MGFLSPSSRPIRPVPSFCCRIIGQAALGFMSGVTDGLITHTVFALLPFSEVSGKPFAEKLVVVARKSIADGISQAIVEGTESSLNALYYWRTRSSTPMTTTRLLAHSLAACTVSSIATELPDAYRCWQRRQLDLKVSASSVLVNTTMLFAGRSVPLLVEKFLEEQGSNSDDDDGTESVPKDSSKPEPKPIHQPVVHQRTTKNGAKERFALSNPNIKLTDSFSSWFIAQLNNLIKRLK